MLRLLFRLLYVLIHWIQPVLVPICFVAAWGMMALMFWSLVSAIKDSWARSQRMHQIPCANCQFFTGDYHLKCTVQPFIALSESAINCPDYQATLPPFTAAGSIYDLE